MKKAGFILLLLTSIFTSGAQTTVQDKQAEQMLKEFYIAHCKIWTTKPVPSPIKFESQLDSLQRIYCTVQIRKKAKEWLKDDSHDLITNDWGIDIKSLNTLKIVRDASKRNAFIVSYIVIAYPQSPNKPVKQPVVLHITVRKENGEFKIATIQDLTKRAT
jgi:hypothetical protein